MRSKMFGLFAPMILLAFHANAATIIDFGVTGLGGNEYQYNYTVFNDGSLGPGVPIQLFDIFFSPALYQAGSLMITSPDSINAEWSQVILASVGTAPADYDAFSLDGGIPVGDSVSGFAVQFQWIGQGLPGAQPFEISDPSSFDILQSGLTTPEPSTFWMLAMALAGFGSLIKAFAFRRRLAGRA